MRNLIKLPKMWQASILTSCLAVLCLLAQGCSTVPVTGRRSLNLIPAGEELQLGLTSFEETKKGTPISKNRAANEQVQRVGKLVAQVASPDLPNAQWEFVVFESKEANAFCLPGGKVGVYTGLLPITRTDAGLAAVIGHEVGHAVAHHGAERMSEALMIQGGGELLKAGMSKRDPKVQEAAALAYGVGMKLGRELPHSRQQELEADQIGLIYMARAGYDPAEAIAFWKRFSEANGQAKNPPGVIERWLSTHPVNAERIKQLEQLLPKAREEMKKPAQ